MGTFATGGGFVTTDIDAGNSDYGRDVAVQSDGKILVAGITSVAGNYDIALARYNSDGSLDTSFATDGKVTADFSGGQENANSVALQSDGKILVAGDTYSTADQLSYLALTRYKSDGSLDTSFGSGGMVTTNIGSSGGGDSVVVQASGKILLAGYRFNGTTDDFVLARYNANGSLDTSFDTDGLVTTSFGDGPGIGHDVVVQTDGKIIVAGTGGSGSVDFALARYKTDGSLDTSFGTNGMLTTDFAASSDYGNAVALQSDGKILVAGESYTSNQDFALARYNTDGSLDTSFDGDGKVITDFGGGFDSGRSIIVQPDGKILVAGNSTNSFAMARYNSDGSLDTSFDGDGMVATDVSAGGISDGYAATLQSNGKILLAGSIWNSASANNDFALARCNTDGSLDTSTVDTTAPTVLALSPADEAIGVGVSDNIVLTFDEAIQKGTGNIVLMTSAGRIMETFKVASSTALSISGDTLTINPSKDLIYATSYKLKIAPGAITDTSGNKYVDTGSYNFTTTDTLTTSASSYTLTSKDPKKLSYVGIGDFIGTGNKVANGITGGIGNDSLNGGLGNDTLTGGDGADQFVFNTKMGKTNIDTITDFTVGTDKIVLDNAVFKKLLSTVTADQLVNGTAALDSNDYLLYDSASGGLFYDADGSGAKVKAVEIALIGTSLDLTADDFIVS